MSFVIHLHLGDGTTSSGRAAAQAEDVMTLTEAELSEVVDDAGAIEEPVAASLCVEGPRAVNLRSSGP